jgi:hypothetical protein
MSNQVNPIFDHCQIIFVQWHKNPTKKRKPDAVLVIR